MVPVGWQLDEASCLLGGDPTGSRNGTTVEGVTIEPGRETTCSFSNSLAVVAPITSVIKAVRSATTRSPRWTSRVVPWSSQ